MGLILVTWASLVPCVCTRDLHQSTVTLVQISLVWMGPN